MTTDRSAEEMTGRIGDFDARTTRAGTATPTEVAARALAMRLRIERRERRHEALVASLRHPR